MDNQKYDVAVLGGGPGGYTAAIKAAQNGLSVALIEEKKCGGTCLHSGCMPWKTLITKANLFRKTKKAMTCCFDGEVKIKYNEIKKYKDQVVAKLNAGLESLIKMKKVSLIKGKGTFVSPKEIKVNESIIEANKIIIATGSEPRELSAFPVDGKLIHDSTSILEIETLPKSLAIIGGGVIGCEAASLFSAFGVEVTIFEALDSLIATFCPNLSSALERSFKRQNINIYTGTKIEKISCENNCVQIQHSSGENLSSDSTLIVVGRKLNTDNIGLEKTGVITKSNGSIEVNNKMQTNIPHIYAIGDITGQQMLAHIASHQGIAVATNTNYGSHAIPSVIFTYPEIATAGLTFNEAKEKGINVDSKKFPLMALGRAQTTGETEGFSQIVFETKTKKIVGTQIIGENASELIAEMTLAINKNLTLEDITDTIHAHPTYSEAWMETAFIANGSPLHAM